VWISQCFEVGHISLPSQTAHLRIKSVRLVKEESKISRLFTYFSLSAYPAAESTFIVMKKAMKFMNKKIAFAC
jgi:hypothetical protein